MLPFLLLIAIDLSNIIGLRLTHEILHREQSDLVYRHVGETLDLLEARFVLLGLRPEGKVLRELSLLYE